MDQNTDNPTPSSEDQPQTPPEYDASAPPIPEQAEPATPAAEVPEISQDSKTMGMLCHLLGLFTSFLGPLILWLIKKDEDQFVDEQGKEALNFQITVIIAGFISGLLSFVCIGFFLAIAVSIADIVFCILATVATNKGEHYRYPYALRLVK